MHAENLDSDQLICYPLLSKGEVRWQNSDVFAAEDIKAADGVSEDYFKADEKVGTITTDSNGIAQMENLPAGKYYVKEVKTAHGYVLDGEPVSYTHLG